MAQGNCHAAYAADCRYKKIRSFLQNPTAPKMPSNTLVSTDFFNIKRRRLIDEVIQPI